MHIYTLQYCKHLRGIAELSTPYFLQQKEVPRVLVLSTVYMKLSGCAAQMNFAIAHPAIPFLYICMRKTAMARLLYRRV